MIGVSIYSEDAVRPYGIFFAESDVNPSSRAGLQALRHQPPLLPTFAMFILSFVKPLAYISLPVLVLRAVSRSNPVARYYVRIGLYLSALGICSVWGALSSIGMTVIGRRFDINWLVARSFYAIAGRWLDITIEVEGEEHLSQRPAVLLGNHQSMLDILILGR